MTDRTLRELLLAGAGAAGVAAAIGVPFSTEVALGILAGGMWNVANLWCLAQALSAWLAPQPAPRRYQLLWFLVKFPLLYVLAFGLMQLPEMSLVGFGIGFVTVIAAAVVIALNTLQPSRTPLSSHGR